MSQKYTIRFLDEKPVCNWRAVINQLKSKLKKTDLSDDYFVMTIAKVRKEKSPSQLGYFHVEIIPKLKIAMKEAGELIPRGIKGDEWVKNQIKRHESIQFVKDVKNVFTGEITTELRSFADASMDEMRHIIDVCFYDIAPFYGIRFTTPEEYKDKFKNKKR